MERVNKLLANRDYRCYLEYNHEAEIEREFCSHHFGHLLDVARLTYLLLIEEGESTACKEAAYAAGLLHDIGRWHQYRFASDHAEYSAKLAEPILEEAGFKKTESRLVTDAIARHRLDEDDGSHLTSLSRALSRADKLSRLCFRCTAGDKCKKINKQPQKERLIY